MSRSLSPSAALRWFGFRRGLKGAIIIGLLVGFMVLLQGYGYIESYPDKAAQEQFAASLEAAPSLGILYGSTDNLSAGVNGYIVYRVVAFMSLIVAVWGLMAITKLLRGSEEDGRWEVIRAGSTTALSSTLHVVIGFLCAFLLSFVIGTGLVILITRGSDFKMPIESALLIGCAAYAPALLAIGLGVLVSQLAVTRRRALLYGLMPLILAYLVRSFANTNTDLKELLNWTPFGWNMLINPVVSPQPWWLLPFILLTGGFLILGLWISRRDLGSSVIKESSSVKSHFYLLGSAWQLALRQNAWVFLGWAGFALAMGGIVASILNIAVDATSSSSSLSQSVYALAGTTDDLRLAFFGAGLVFVVMVLLILATVIVGTIRHDEAKQYLDNILVQPKTRTMWLMSRLVLGAAVTFVISFACITLMYFAAPHDLPLDFAKLAALSISVLGTIGFLIGFGTLFYGVFPRLAVLAMYLVIIWSFLIDLVGAVVKLDDIFVKSSLFHYMTFNVSAWPDWSQFSWLVGLGVAMAAVGIICFTKRDIITE